MHYARGEGYEVNEALFTNDEDFKHCLYQIAGNATVSCKVNGGGKEKPSIMAKVLRGDFEMDLKSAKVFINEWV